MPSEESLQTRAGKGRARDPPHHGPAAAEARRGQGRRSASNAQESAALRAGRPEHADDRRRRRRDRPDHPRHQRQSLRLLQSEARLLLRVQPDPRRQPRAAAARAAADARAPALSGRLADAVLWLRCQRDRRQTSRMLALDIDPKLAWALRHRDRFPLDVNTRQPRGTAARAGLRRQGGRPHHRHAPPHLDPRRDLARLHIPRNKALPFIVLTDHRPQPQLLESAMLASDSNRRRRNWDLGFDADSSSSTAKPISKAGAKPPARWRSTMWRRAM